MADTAPTPLDAAQLAARARILAEYRRQYEETIRHFTLVLNEVAEPTEKADAAARVEVATTLLTALPS